MTTPFLGEIRIMSFNFPPKGWAFCNGLLLPINQNQALFSILGTTYGGNGQTTFALPDFQGRIPVGVGQGIVLGQKAGEENHTLIASEMPTHVHGLTASSNTATVNTPSTNLLAKTNTTPTPSPIYTDTPSGPLVPMYAGAIQNFGGSQPHANTMPFLVLNFCIAMTGTFPSRN